MGLIETTLTAKMSLAPVLNILLDRVSFAARPASNFGLFSGWYVDSIANLPCSHTLMIAKVVRHYCTGRNPLTLPTSIAGNYQRRVLTGSATENLAGSICVPFYTLDNIATAIAYFLNKFFFHALYYTLKRQPFAGSGSEVIGGELAGWEDVTGVEQSEEYCRIADARSRFWACNSGLFAPEEADAPAQTDLFTEAT